MLRALEIENFKAFGKRTRVEFAPITLIFGENSAGKSSLLHALNLLKQTRESRDLNAVLLPRAERGLVDLGSFQELLFDHDTTRTLTFRLDIAARRSRNMPDLPLAGNGEDAPCEIGFEFGVRREPADNEVQLDHISLYLGGLQEPIARFEPTELEHGDMRLFRSAPYSYARYRRQLRRHEVQAARCVDVNTQACLWKSSYEGCLEHRETIVAALLELRGEEFGKRPTYQRSLFREEEHAKSSIDSAIAFYSSNFSLDAFVERFALSQLQRCVALEGFLPVSSSLDRSIDFPESIAVRQFARPPASRDLFRPDMGQLLVDASRYLDECLASVFPLGPYRRPPQRLYIFTGTTPQDVGYSGDFLPDLLFREPSLVEDTNAWLTKLKLGYQIDIRPVGKNSTDLFEVRLIDTRRQGSVDVGLTDVGFGISQLLPLIVQSLASSNQIITIEQPEVHIHPRLQADLGDLLAAAIGDPRNNRFIVETHSEHLVLRMQKLVRQGILQPRDIQVLFVSRGIEGSRVHPLRIDDEGDFVDEWPGGFFPERLRELR